MIVRVRLFGAEEHTEWRPVSPLDQPLADALAAGEGWYPDGDDR